MSGRNGIKIAAVISCTIMALWFLLSLTAIVYQDSILQIMGGAGIAEDTDRIILWDSIAQAVLSVPVAVACIMVIQEKGGAMPLILSGVFSMINPVVTSITSVLQNMFTARITGAAELVRVASLSNFMSFISYLLNAAYIIAVAACAVYYYAVKNNHLTTNPHKEEKN